MACPIWVSSSIFLGAPLGVVHDHVIFQREPDLQCQTNQQLQIRRAEQTALRVRKKDHAEVVFAGLQADGSRVVNILRDQGLPELVESPARERRQRLSHFRHIGKSHKPAAAIRQFADVFSSATGVEVARKLRRETQLHRRQHRAPAFRDANHRMAGRKRRDQPFQNRLHAWHQITRRQQPHRVDAQRRKRERIFLHRIALILKQHHHHGDAEKHLRDGTQKIAAKHLQERRLNCPSDINTAHNASANDSVRKANDPRRRAIT